MLAFLRNKTGNVAIVAAIMLPVIIFGAGGAVDFYIQGNQRASLKELSDLLATRGAREFLLANATPGQIKSVINAAVQNGVADNYTAGEFDLQIDIDSKNTTVSVSVSQSPKPGLILTKLKQFQSAIKTRSTAVARGGMNVCIVALEQSADGAIQSNINASLNAEDCSIMSNSKGSSGIVATGSSAYNAGLICSSGGYYGLPKAFNPSVTVDCPVYSDPLRERQPPTFGACDETDLVLGELTEDITIESDSSSLQEFSLAAPKMSGDSAFVEFAADSTNDIVQVFQQQFFTLDPGVYCGGIAIGANANVTMNPGTYVIKDGPLIVDVGAELNGVNSSFYLTGDDATFHFSAESKISLTAEKSGPLAGILFFEDRSAPQNRVHRILSNDARTLLGTFYLPRGILSVASVQPVADQSAYTVIVAKKLQMTGSPTLVLNSNYGATDIPVPTGVGPVGGNTYLRE